MSSEDDTYVHTPGALDEGSDEEGADGAAADGDGTDDTAADGTGTVDAAGDGRTVTTRAPGDDVVHPTATEREFDWRGWILVGVLFVAFVIAPLVVYLQPPQLPWRVTLIVFPLLPALLLGVVAVWATTRP